jgi:hypothetical protein
MQQSLIKIPDLLRLPCVLFDVLTVSSLSPVYFFVLCALCLAAEDSVDFFARWSWHLVAGATFTNIMELERPNLDLGGFEIMSKLDEKEIDDSAIFCINSEHDGALVIRFLRRIFYAIPSVPRVLYVQDQADAIRRDHDHKHTLYFLMARW